MLGSVTACTLASLVLAPIPASEAVRPPMAMIIGVMLRAEFAPKVIQPGEVDPSSFS
jgi:hypothetical protein